MYWPCGLVCLVRAIAASWEIWSGLAFICLCLFSIPAAWSPLQKLALTAKFANWPNFFLCCSQRGPWQLFNHFSLFIEYIFFLTTISQSPNTMEVEASALLREKHLTRARGEITFLLFKLNPCCNRRTLSSFLTGTKFLSALIWDQW